MDERLAQLVERLEARGFVKDGVSKWGRPVPPSPCAGDHVQAVVQDGASGPLDSQASRLATPQSDRQGSQPSPQAASQASPQFGLSGPLNSQTSHTLPQTLKEASPLQRRLVECSYGTPSPGEDLCAAWVEQCFSRLGLGVVLGDAASLYQGFCHHTSLDELKVGMIVAVDAQPYSLAGMSHGHVGLYVGDGLVRDAVGNQVRTVPLELWLCAYGLMSEPRWGWLGGIGLA